VVPPGDDVRPTSDRVREAVFNALRSLGAVEGARVLDLFAGSGALAVEALSAGAASAVLVERDRAARRAIEANLTAAGVADRAQVVASDALRHLADAAGEPFDLALVDPPYAFDAWPQLLAALAERLAPEAVVVLESDRWVPVPEGWHVQRDKRYGGTFVRIAIPPPSPAPLGPNRRSDV
jgi:16S rRNA (guanine966-N2)-methyltransferase